MEQLKSSRTTDSITDKRFLISECEQVQEAIIKEVDIQERFANNTNGKNKVGDRVKTYDGEIGIIIGYGELFEYRVEITKWNYSIYGYDSYQLTTPSLLDRIKWLLLK